MWIFFSMFLVTVSLKICSKIYKTLFPGMNLISEELVLFPFRFYLKSNPYYLFLMSGLESEFLMSQKDSEGTQKEEPCQAT